MREEEITLNAAASLETQGWQVLAIDFPQSGSTFRLRRSDSGSDKTKGMIVPDIVAIKDGLVIIVESKVGYDLPDREKLARLKGEWHLYKESLLRLVDDITSVKVCFGTCQSVDSPIGSSTPKSVVDFILGVAADGSLQVLQGDLKL